MPKAMTQSSSTSSSTRVGDGNLSEDQMPRKGKITTANRIRKANEKPNKRGTIPMSLIEFRFHTYKNIAALEKEIARL